MYKCIFENKNYLMSKQLHYAKYGRIQQSNKKILHNNKKSKHYWRVVFVTFCPTFNGQPNVESAVQTWKHLMIKSLQMCDGM